MAAAGAAAADDDAAGAGAADPLPVLAEEEPPSRAFAALSFGCALPKPQPPSRVWAMTAPAHSAEWKPQHPDSQSASDVQRPVMNCLPALLPASPGLLLALGVAGVSRAARAWLTTG